LGRGRVQPIFSASGPDGEEGEEETQMKTWHQNVMRAIAGCALLVACANAIAAAPARDRTATAPDGCSVADTQIWLGVGEGGGFAGGYGLPLEFSNVGQRTCTLYGYPDVSAYRGALRQVGPAALRMREPHAVVTLAPRATAFAFLRITDAGAVCGRNPVSADGLKVSAPGMRAAKTISTPVTVCAHQAVLAVGAIRAGVGIPGYITQ
jgi:Protein of unknown function (DUF4232)